MKRRCAVEENVFALDNCVKRVPNDRFTGFDETGCGTNVVCILIADQPADDKWLEAIPDLFG